MVKKIIAFVAFGCTLFSSDVMSLYKSGGMKAIEKEIDRGLGDASYWMDILADQDLRFGYFESTDTLLACNKEKSTLELYTRDTQKHFVLLKRFSAFTGKYDGDKMTEGDRRTPIGIYALTQKKSNVDPFYGPMAFVTSYPNLYDRIRGKNGSGIWIHGVPEQGERNEFTKGCIVINNSDLVHLDHTINPATTVLIIDSQIQPKHDLSPYSTIMGELYRWRYAWMYNDLNTYLSFYGPSFKRFDGMDLNQFKLYKQQIFARNESKSIVLKNIQILPYPGEQSNLYLITFEELYQADTHRFNGTKTLMVTLNVDKSISILSEE
jgi:murein L,D-transpeptidase YafK